MKIIQKILLCSLILNSMPAAVKAAPNLGTTGEAPLMLGQIGADVQRVPANPFPDAVTAKVFVGTGMKISSLGDVTVTSINGFPIPKDPAEVPAPTYGSADLTATELQQLRASIFFTLTPRITLTPRNRPRPDWCNRFIFYTGYTFFDASGRYLGDILICPLNFMALSPVPANSTGLPALDYDSRVQYAILQAHHLAPPVSKRSIDSGTQKIPVPIFPTATVVKAYTAEDLRVAAGGRVTSGSAALPFLGTFNVHEASLTKGEIQAVQSSIYFTQYPASAESCFDGDNLAFTFYDAAGRYLGFFAFGGCGLPTLSPMPVNSTGLPSISWDSNVIMKIFAAHHLPIPRY